MENTIYEKLGAENLEQMVNKFYEYVLDNPILSPLFTTDMEVVRQKQLAFLTQFLGHLWSPSYADAPHAS